MSSTGDDESVPRVKPHHLIALMQEPAMVLAEPPAGGEPGLRVVSVNEAAARVLGLEDSGFAEGGLCDLLPAELVAVLTSLCAEARTSGRPVYRAVAAPDPLTDLSRTPTIAVRVTRVEGVLVLTWLPGWLSGVDEPRVALSGGAVAERLAIADAVDALADAGIGVYALDLMTGRLTGSAGLRRVFAPRAGGVGADPADPLARFESVLADVDEWQALLRHGTPMDVRVGLGSGDRKARIIGRVAHGADGFPTVVRGGVSVTE